MHITSQCLLFTDKINEPLLSSSGLPKLPKLRTLIKIENFTSDTEDFMTLVEQPYRSSHPEVSCENGVLINFTNFFFNKVAGLRQQSLLTC